MTRAETVYVELEVTVSSLGEALSELTSAQVVKTLSIADDRSQDGELLREIHRWLIPRHRDLDQETVDEESRARGCCVRSTHYPDISSHTDPHKDCPLR